MPSKHRKPGQVVFAPREGLHTGGKGDFPRNVGPKFRENLDKVDWSNMGCPPDCRCVLHT